VKATKVFNVEELSTVSAVTTDYDIVYMKYLPERHLSSNDLFPLNLFAFIGNPIRGG
jgi:hypothetical protein